MLKENIIGIFIRSNVWKRIWSFYMWIQPPVDLVNWPGQVSRNYHLQHVCLQSLTLSCLPFVYVVTIWTILHYHNWLVAYYFIIKFNPVGYISTRYDQRRRKSCADFRSRVASPVSMTYIAFHSNLVPRTSLQWGKLHKLVQPSSTSFPGSGAKKKRVPGNEVRASPSSDGTVKSQMLQEYCKPKQKTR